jgi:hypothetical protein
MNDFLPAAVRQGLEEARKRAIRQSHKLSVHDGDDVYRIHRFWEGGFALDAGVADKLRGRVEIYDGSRHLYQALVISSERSGSERVFDFKWVHPVSSTPAVDFVREGPPVAGLLGR